MMANTTASNIATPPTAIPATASPRPCCPLCLIWFSATKPITMPAMAPTPPKMPKQKNDERTPMTDATSEPIASPLVDPDPGAAYRAPGYPDWYGGCEG